DGRRTHTPDPRGPAPMTLPASQTLRAVRGEILHFLSDPAAYGAAAIEHFADGILAIRDGHVAELGPAEDMLAKLPSDIVLDDYRGKLILPGFVDTHIHYAQTDI